MTTSFTSFMDFLSYSIEVVRLFGTFAVTSYTPKIFSTDALLTKTCMNYSVIIVTLLKHTSDFSLKIARKPVRGQNW